MTSAHHNLYHQDSQMSSQLRVLLVGSFEGMTETGNTLLCREAFTLTQPQAQRRTVNLPDGRLLQVTAAYYRHKVTEPDGTKRLSEELVSDITSSVYHAVIFIMEIGSSFRLFYPTTAEYMMKDKSWKNFVQRKCVIVVTGGDRFKEAQSKGEITVSFIDWMRELWGIPETLFQETQERCLLFDNSGFEVVVNKQRDELIDMIDNRVIVGEYYTDMKLKEAELLLQKLETNLEELKQNVQINTKLLEENSQKTDVSLKDMNNQLEGLKKELLKEIGERNAVIQTIKDKFDKDSKDSAQRSEMLGEQLNNSEKVCKTILEEAVRNSQELEKQVLEFKKQALQEKIERKDETQTERESSLWERFKSLAMSHLQLHTERKRNLLLMLFLLLLLLLPLLSSLWPVTSNSRKEITALDVRSDLRRYVDLKLELAVKRIRKIEKHLAGLNILDVMKSQKSKKVNQTDHKNVSKIRLEMVDQITELKERLLNETAKLTKDIRKNIAGRILVWDMIKSLPLSLPLIMVLTLLLLLLTPVPLPVPWAWLLAALLVALLILQFLLLLVLLGA
ncbi:hypothetical protein RRG08_012804 [Elysia crispata]|uniref:AIG1-type G domain-containing protein n=1 Tax=Elysia crispata TaxID=231223 RepID=A0AAE1D8R8_9GAST|nr:hypothetical protein RRG08_012804 [Elysia crispata]